MNLEEIKKEISALSAMEREEILKELSQESLSLRPSVKSQEARRFQLDNKLGSCGH